MLDTGSKCPKIGHRQRSNQANVDVACIMKESLNRLEHANHSFDEIPFYCFELPNIECK